MYYQYFGLDEAPFSIAVNPRYLFMSSRHRDALAHLLYGVGAGGGFILLTGEVGTGKTTINRCLLQQLPAHADIAIILNPALDARDLLATVCEELGIEFSEANPGLKALTSALHRFLLDNYQAGRKTVLMIDEAQHLGFDVLEQIRLLTNLETDEEKLLHIILIGQPELAHKLARPELRQLNQRITARFDLQPLSVEETGAYIRHRLHVAGMPAGHELFQPSLVRALHRQTRGVPRLINLLCDRMLLGAYGRDSTRLDHQLLRQAAREVTGEDLAESSSRRWALGSVAAVAVLLVMLGLWWLLSPAASESSSAAEGSVSAAEGSLSVAEGSLSAAEGSSSVAEGSLSAAEGSLSVAEGSSSAGEIANSVARPAPAVSVQANPPVAADLVPRWRLSAVEGRTLLASLYAVPAGATPCDLPEGTSLRCEFTQAQSWNQILAEGRPALLEIVDARRFEGRVLFLGIDEAHALVATPRGVRRVSLEQLAPEWTGRLWRYWVAPVSFSGALQLGSRGNAVREVAMLFATLDGRSDPLTDDRYDNRLRERVRLFQRERGLEADGMFGAQTLRALVLATGADLSLAAAAESVRRRSAAGEWP